VQRFRIYAYDANDHVIGEITAENAEITWSVHLANSKAAWYEFFNPLDNGNLSKAIPGGRRNKQLIGKDQREQLIVDGGEVLITGSETNANGSVAKYRSQGKFLGSNTVTLGHLQTDGKGRLLVVPGDGASFSPTNHKIDSFADNDEWIDDWCDGPVRAKVRLKGDSSLREAAPAWVACVGPNFAPEITPLVTLYDVIHNLNRTQGWETLNREVSFRRDIYPILQRLDLMRWVSEAALLQKGWIDLGPLHKESYLKKLSGRGPGSSRARQKILAKIRKPPTKDNPGTGSNQGEAVPWMLGDGVNDRKSPLFMFSITETQYANLKRWANDDFIDDYQVAKEEKIQHFDDIPLEQQPDALTRSALEACSGGAFHPGVELTYNLRHSGLYQRHYDPNSEPYRLAIGNRSSLLHDLGEKLDAEVFFYGRGQIPSPIGKQMPGDLTRWMGIPWQCDAFSCQSVDFEQDFPTATWWPAQVPIDVLPEAFYFQAINPQLTPEERSLFTHQRKRWSRRVAGVGYHASQSYWDGIENMIALWQRMGIVVRRPNPLAGKLEDGDLPADFFVETGRGQIDRPSPADQR
jgi:L-Lysine epsilon oxidase N-terminal/L-lysine epsilon oxidase C-terminal domain